MPGYRGGRCCESREPDNGQDTVQLAVSLAGMPKHMPYDGSKTPGPRKIALCRHAEPTCDLNCYESGVHESARLDWINEIQQISDQDISSQ